MNKAVAGLLNIHLTVITVCLQECAAVPQVRWTGWRQILLWMRTATNFEKRKRILLTVFTGTLPKPHRKFTNTPY
jgi:hypothetical protein